MAKAKPLSDLATIVPLGGLLRGVAHFCYNNADLEGANLKYAGLRGAYVKGTILEGKEEPSQDITSLSEKVKELEEENKKLKEKLNQLKTFMDT